MDIEISPSGSLLVYKRGYTPEFVFNVITKKKLKGLRIFAILKEDKLDNIDFLKNYIFLEALDVTSSYDYSLDFLGSLTELEELSITNEGKQEVDLKFLSNLKELTVNCRNRKVSNFDSVSKLEKLCLVDFKKGDFELIKCLSSLKALKVKTSSVKSSKGLGQLVNLQQLSLGNFRSLAEIEEIANLNHLLELEFDNCPKVRNFDSLKDLPKLESLSISNCKQIDSIGFVKNLPSLKRLSLLESTDVADGDLTPAKDIPDVYYKHREHYNIRIVNLEYEARIKRNLENIKTFTEQLNPK